MEELTIPRKGPIEGISRILRELLRTPGFKKSINILLSDLDPENARLLVRTLVWEDPTFFLGLFGAMPGMVNALIEGTRELAVQLSIYPTAALADFLENSLKDIDAEALGEGLALNLLLLLKAADAGGGRLGEAAGGLRSGVAAGFEKAMSAQEGDGREAPEVVLDVLVPMMKRAAARIGGEASSEGSGTAKLVKGLADGIRDVGKENPDFMKSVVAPLVEAYRQALAGTGEGGEA